MALTVFHTAQICRLNLDCNSRLLWAELHHLQLAQSLNMKVNILNIWWLYTPTPTSHVTISWSSESRIFAAPQWLTDNVCDAEVELADCCICLKLRLILQQQQAMKGHIKDGGQPSHHIAQRRRLKTDRRHQRTLAQWRHQESEPNAPTAQGSDGRLLGSGPSEGSPAPTSCTDNQLHWWEGSPWWCHHYEMEQ